MVYYGNSQWARKGLINEEHASPPPPQLLPNPLVSISTLHIQMWCDSLWLSVFGLIFSNCLGAIRSAFHYNSITNNRGTWSSRSGEETAKSCQLTSRNMEMIEFLKAREWVKERNANLSPKVKVTKFPGSWRFSKQTRSGLKRTEALNVNVKRKDTRSAISWTVCNTVTRLLSLLLLCALSEINRNVCTGQLGLI